MVGCKIEGMKLLHAYIATDSAENLIMSALCSGDDGQAPCMTCAHCGKVMRGTHPDVITVEPHGREIVVDQIRAINRDAHIVPNDADRKVYVVKNAGAMNTSAQNSFLKLLEDPPRHAVFILMTDTPERLLPTVRSRCVDLTSAAAPAQESDSDAYAAVQEMCDSFFAALCRDNAALCDFSFKLERLEREEFLNFITLARLETAVRLKAMEDKIPHTRLSLAERVLCRAEDFLLANVGAGHVSGMICASLIDV